jgi:hypothetical protein
LKINYCAALLEALDDAKEVHPCIFKECLHDMIRDFPDTIKLVLIVFSV